jgi:Truncated hemoglobins
MTDSVLGKNRQRDLYAAIGSVKIAAIVDDFYGRVQQHPTLSKPFSIVKDWDEHKRHLAHFWWISLGGPTYRPDKYRVADKHVPLGITAELVDDWLALFQATLRDHLPDELVEPWLVRARSMGESIRLMADFYQDQ